MHKGRNTEYGIRNTAGESQSLEYGKSLVKSGGLLLANGKIITAKLGINCVQPCANTGVQTVSLHTHKPQLNEQQNYSRFIHPQYPQPNHPVLHCLFTHLSTGLNKLITDTEVDFTTVST